MQATVTLEELRDIFRANLKAARKGKGWTQARLAEEAGLAQATVAQLENGSRSPTLDRIAKLAQAMECDPDLFLRSGTFSKSVKIGA